MASTTKISTCSYCQARVIMNITAGSRHELICSACGAPLQETEFLTATPPPVAAQSFFPQFPKKESDSNDSRKKESRSKESNEKERQAHSRHRSRDDDSRYKDRKKRKKKRRGLGYWIREAIDEIEDLFD